MIEAHQVISEGGSGENLPSFIHDEMILNQLKDPRIMKSPPMSQNTGDDKLSVRLKQMREEYERIKEEVHQSLTHTNLMYPENDKINDSKLLLNLSLPSGGGI